MSGFDPACVPARTATVVWAALRLALSRMPTCIALIVEGIPARAGWTCEKLPRRGVGYRRMRGGVHSKGCVRRVRFTPARAGPTLPSPAAALRVKGLPPRARGRHRQQAANTVSPGSTPAYAGLPEAGAGCRWRHRVEPRVRGVGSRSGRLVGLWFTPGGAGFPSGFVRARAELEISFPPRGGNSLSGSPTPASHEPERDRRRGREEPARPAGGHRSGPDEDQHRDRSWMGSVFLGPLRSANKPFHHCVFISV